MRIEKANPSQLKEIFRIFIECKLSMDLAHIFQWTDNYPTIHHISGDIGNGYLHSLNHNGKSLGVINVSDIQEPEYNKIPWLDKEGKSLVIHRLAIHPNNQRQGLARMLMDFAENYAKDNGYTSVKLDAYSGNERVLRFYENRGYQKRGEVNFIGRTLPFHCYELKLNV
jgi:ribosomal protein S18 acetylase RimI-like enzyme